MNDLWIIQGSEGDLSQKEEKKIIRNGELYGALVELDYTKTLLEHQLNDILIEVKSIKSAIRGVTKRLKAGSEMYEKNHGKLNLKKGK